MSNYSEGTHVPFGDGSHVPPEEMTESDATMQAAMKNIFLSCDPNNSNFALVSDLINFMTPHMQENTSELTLLKIALDPDYINPRVNSETFYKVMMEWSSQFMDESVEINNDHDTSLGESNKEKDFLCGSSLSKTSVRQRFLKGYAEFDNMNLSNSSIYSCTGNSGTDVTALQEKINELEYQNKKLTEDLEHSRNQLTNSEEQNEALHAEVQKANHRLLVEQQANRQLDKDRQNTEELIEASAAAQKQISKLEKDLASAEKQVAKHKQQIRSLETENQNLEDRIEQLLKRDIESKQVIQKLQAELHLKEQEITSLEEAKAHVDVRLSEQKQLVSHYSNVNKSLKEDKLKMEKHYCDTIKSQILSSHLERVSQTFSEYSNSSISGTSKNPSILNPEKESLNVAQENCVAPPILKERQFHSPLAKLYKNKGFIFNSPRLLNMIANPVTPPLNNSDIITSSVSCKKSVDSDDSPALLCGKHEVNSVFTYTSSTPEKSTKTLLDQTPPSVVRKLPHLMPTHKSPSNQHHHKNKSPTIKKDLALFRQYRFVGGSSSDEEESNCHTAEHPEVDVDSISQVKQEYDANLNLVTHLEEQKESLSLLYNEDEGKESSLPTIYVLERSSGRRRSKSASSYSPNSLKNIADISYEDDPLIWKSCQKIAPHESLESEISQAKLLDSENAELKSALHHLVKENNRLKSQVSSSIEKVKNYSPAKRENYYETECKALKVKIQDLESDNNRKYIKIIDLMEEKEKLHKELKRVNGKDADEIKKLKQNISELHHEKCGVLRELQQEKLGKQNYDTTIRHLQSIKHDCDVLQNLLQQSRRNGDNLAKELDKICAEKYELRTKVDKLKRSMCEVNEKNSELSIKLQNLSDAYIKLKKNLKVRTPEEKGLPKTHDNTNPELYLPAKKNKELTYEQSCQTLKEIRNDNSKGFEAQVEDIKTVEKVITQHKATIESLKNEITDLSATNTRLSQNTAEKENQILALKQIISHQNESLSIAASGKETSTTKLYEQKCENEKLYENNKELSKTNNELMKQLEHIQKEKEYMCVRLDNLEEENKSILAEFKLITGDYKTSKDSENNLLKDYELLVTEKELLAKRNEQLTNDFKKITALKEEIEQQLLDIKNEAIHLSNPQQCTAPAESVKLASSKRKSKELQEPNRYPKVLSMIRQKIIELENTNKQLQSENENLQKDFDGIRSNYETLSNEKEMWLMEKNEWQQLRDELSKKLTTAMTESKLLEDELTEQNTSSQESLERDESSCSNCLVLKTEIEDLNTRLNELQDQNSKKNQVRRYDRMQITIEKLKSKTYVTEEQLKSEKEKNAKLELENSSLKTEVQENWKKHTKDSAKLESENSRLRKEAQEKLHDYKTEKVDMVEKLSNSEEQLKKLQSDMQEVQQEKRFLLQDCNNLKEKLEAAVKEKENRLKSINKETSHLKQEIQELTKQKTKLEKKLETSENLLKCKPNMDKITKENSQLKQEIEDANKQITEIEKKLEKVEQNLKEKRDEEQKNKEYQACIVKENLDMKQQMEDLEKKLEQLQNDLQKSEERNLSIRKELVDMQTDYDTTNCSEFINVEKLTVENDSLQKQLVNYENELVAFKIKLNDSSNCLHSLSEHVKDVNQKLNEKRQRLHRSTLTAVSNWRATLEKAPDKKPVLEVVDIGEPGAPQQMFIGPLDEEMFKFKHQIHVTSLVLEALGKLKTSRVPVTCRDAEIQVSGVPPPSPQKSVKKFISKTKTGSARSVSPDSPSQKGKARSTDTSPLRSKTAPALSIQSSEASPRNEVKLSRSTRPSSPSKNIKLQSTATSPLRSIRPSAIPVRSRETSPVNKYKHYASSDTSCSFDANVACYKSPIQDREASPVYKSKNYVSLDGSCLCATDVPSYKLPDDDDTEDSTSEDGEVETGLGTNKNSPSLSNSTLESLGLLYEGDSPNWSKKEIEEKFHILVTCFMMDVVTIKERYKNQHIHQSKIERKFSVESKNVVATLKDIKKLDRDHHVKVLITACLHQVKQLVWMFSQMSALAMQCGALQHEQYSLKVINVMINHAANLRQVVENSTPRLKSIGSFTSSPKHRRTRNVLVHSSSSSLTLRGSSIFELSNDDSQEFPDQSLNESGKINEHNITALMPCRLNNEVKKLNSEHHSRTGTGIFQKILHLLLFLTIVAAVVLIGFEYTPNGITVRGYPWRWVSWNDIFAPFITQTYAQGPPPT